MEIECHGLDTPDHVFFYEQDFYVLSNFSSFTLKWKNIRFDTLEHAYQWEKFNYTPDPANATRLVDLSLIRKDIQNAPSAHEAFQIAQRYKNIRRPDWDKEDDMGVPVKVYIMLDLLRAKVRQHEYAKRKLLDTGKRRLTENSFRDSYWGWGPDQNGQDMLGKCWMKIRDEVERHPDRF